MGKKNIWLEGCAPGFFVSVASKEFSSDISLLFATLAGKWISVAAKGLRAGGIGEKWSSEVGPPSPIFETI
jgi:hypothetical protein